MSKRKRVTIREVAARAGVSATAVSFAFNSPRQLNSHTCSRIRQIAAEMKYQPHPVARTLATGRTDTIGLVMPVGLHFALNDSFFRLFVGEFGNLCDRHRLRLLMLPIWEDSNISSLASIAADGFLVIGLSQNHPISQEIENSSRPIVLLDCESTIAAPSLLLDDFRGAYKAASHLLKQGHRRIAVSSMRYTPSKLKAMPFASRLGGYQQAVDDAGLGQDALQVVFTEEDGLMFDDPRPFDDIWSLAPRPSAAVCVSDARALKIMHTAKERGLSIPDDLAIVGFDNIPDAEAVRPQLTTIDQDIKGRCLRAFEFLHGLIQESSNGKLDNVVITDPVKLIVRQSG